MHFIRLLDAVGIANKYLVIQTLLCDFFFCSFYVFAFWNGSICIMSLKVYQKPGDQERVVE